MGKKRKRKKLHYRRNTVGFVKADHMTALSLVLTAHPSSTSRTGISFLTAYCMSFPTSAHLLKYGKIMTVPSSVLQSGICYE